MSKLTWDSKNFKGILKTVPNLQMGYNSKYHLQVGCSQNRLFSPRYSVLIDG